MPWLAVEADAVAPIMREGFEKAIILAEIEQEETYGNGCTAGSESGNHAFSRDGVYLPLRTQRHRRVQYQGAEGTPTLEHTDAFMWIGSSPKDTFLARPELEFGRWDYVALDFNQWQRWVGDGGVLL